MSFDDAGYVNGLKVLKDEVPKSDQKYTVVHYLIPEEVEKGGDHGLIFIDSSYSTAEDAIKRGKILLKKTNISGITVIPNCTFKRIGVANTGEKTIYVNTDKDKKKQLNNKLDDIWRENLKESRGELKEQARRDKLREKISKEHMMSDEPGNIEYYHRRWYLAVKNYVNMKKNEELVKYYQDMYDKRINDTNKLICIDYLNRLSQINEALDDVFTTGRKNGK